MCRLARPCAKTFAKKFYQCVSLFFVFAPFRVAFTLLAFFQLVTKIFEMGQMRFSLLSLCLRSQYDLIFIVNEQKHVNSFQICWSRMRVAYFVHNDICSYDFCECLHSYSFRTFYYATNYNTAEKNFGKILTQVYLKTYVTPELPLGKLTEWKQIIQ